MKLIQGDLWDYSNKPGFIICITTNGFVKKNGEAVMGRGCAKEASVRYPELPWLLGRDILEKGNIPHWYEVWDNPILTFPVKHNWWEKADLELINLSASFLRRDALKNSFNTYILPKPGCGNGQLTWEEVEPLLKDLPDNVWVISK